MAAPKKYNTEPDAKSPREAILGAAINAIATGGESSVRITEVAREAGVTQGMISYYFRDREGLVTEAHLERFRGTYSNDTDSMFAAATSVTSPEEFKQFLLAITRETISLRRSANRRTRTMVLGSALARPDLLARVTETQSEMIDQMEEVAVIAQERGYLRKDLNPRAIAEYVTSSTLGMIVADLDAKRPSDDEIVKVVSVFIDGIVTRPD